ncbi:hypothetical protein GCM10009613_23260 [Pseudonocardia kongjuensis]|uniref:Uncharacterized protein n=1 Tax=Pseudonocardia kongjuensis TaxID=102227 RepID=A0ABP4IIJ6_9PSEU
MGDLSPERSPIGEIRVQERLHDRPFRGDRRPRMRAGRRRPAVLARAGREPIPCLLQADRAGPPQIRGVDRLDPQGG